MEHLITDIILIIAGGLLGFYFFVYLEAKKEKERRRWERFCNFYRGNNDR